MLYWPLITSPHVVFSIHTCGSALTITYSNSDWSYFNSESCTVKQSQIATQVKAPASIRLVRHERNRDVASIHADMNPLMFIWETIVKLFHLKN